MVQEATLIFQRKYISNVCVCVIAQSCPILCGPLTVACQVPLSLGLFRQEYWSGLLRPSPAYLLNPGNESASPVSPALQADSLLAEPSW